MGQSNSRPNPPSPPPQAPEEAPKEPTQDSPESTSADVVPEAATEDGVPASRSRRSSMRKSLLNFVKPSSIRSRVTSIASAPGDARRSWRNARRWSKAPVDPRPPPPAVDSTPSSSSGPSAEPSCNVKGKQPEREPPIEDEEEFHEAVEALEEPPMALPEVVLSEPTSPASSSWVNVQDRDQSPEFASVTPPEPEPQPYAPNHATTSTPPPEFSESDPQPSAQPPTAPRPAAAPLPHRQFPPPGTLVVVQGIVHTTDVSRTPSPAAPTAAPTATPTPGPAPSQPPSTANSRPASHLDVERDQAPSRARNRLSALLRPRSASSRRSSALINDASPTPTPPPEPELPTSESSTSSSSAESAPTDVTIPLISDSAEASSSQPQPTELPSSEPQQQQQQSQPQTENRAPAISSSSIDVLGTLLSVAAAATAASLLTGSSEPILSSGLAPPSGAGSTPSSASTTSLPNPHRGHPQAPDITANGRAERMRQAWSTIRERLGLRPSPPVPTPTNNNNASGTDDTPLMEINTDGNATPADNLNANGLGQGPTDTRELMLAEMARAFNIGLGLNGLGGMTPPAGAASQGSATPGAEGDSEAVGAGVERPPAEGDAPETQGRGEGHGQTQQPSTSPTLPPEGSFERFLVDLQTDLRVALTQVEDVPGQQPVQEPQEEHVSAQLSSMQAQPSTVGSANEEVAAPAASSSPSFGTVPPPASTSERNDRHDHGVDTRRRDGDDASVSSMPYLEEITDSDSESEFDEAEEYDDADDFHSAPNGSIPHLGGAAQHDHRPHAHTHTHTHAHTHTHTHAHTQTHPAPAAHGLGATAGTTNHIDAAGRINWWRLYRFPPILSTRVELPPGRRQGSGVGTPAPAAAAGSTVAESGPNPESAVAPTPSVNLEGSSEPAAVIADPLATTPSTSSTQSSLSPDVPSISPHSTPSSSASPSTSSPSTSPFSNTNNTTPSSSNTNSMPTLTSPPPFTLDAVVPVIVVGLQSVNSEWPPDVPPTQGTDEGIDFFGQPPASGSDAGVDPIDGEEMDESDPWGVGDAQAMGMGAGAEGAGRANGRPRGWQSRAANAIRNLRPGGRRNAEAGAGGLHNPTQMPSLAAPGSRTFLIYVIGGYYPPDHNIVTGGPTLDSFDALIELADLLGHVKPPTVSKDEIEKSGLETIKASQVAQYEKDGKISSNCTDRCLICLDDYDPEDNVRVMTCRHAFHKNCVDEWLQRGRNNCPACRTTGVSTDTPTPSVPTS
ncbi:unnamed protein product [Cyclocybe aegerita]|uniref:RING-type domain-containing protein n=1 Tax=Cyclocybe aegerita TaxID=1973307 RepID=A0A8S0X3K1_CYCAE|nr:unnamed protein product [Cyclocybe aegerita]